ncbi:DUF2500 domain-containing protein [Photobacterium rosenbergii]|uniref:DUF2500 domain-containing protein n=1 Tax=Photobacterium rosenbergii TaxID=294936 RepID=A0A2T3NCI0_9GAMM|nr:DUF2500 domain-containing protein [Photobacterium rosenbergii]MBY5947088.1 DUF2500 domain-containing protein [Photobacterium rosenbergii]PSW11764.1 DUF2500 domain-containing protein [Photobacterium rosenbergii]
MPIAIPATIIALLAVALYCFVHIYRKHTLGENAPERQIEVEILDKQSTPVIGARPGEDDEEYWIYVQPTKGGPKREFMVGIHYYHALNPGDKGVMTYQGTTFRHFALKRD